MQRLLTVDGLAVAYAGTPALHGISLEVAAGAVTALVGANGAGKTTTLRAISNVVRKTGSVVFDGREIGALAPDRIARLGVAHVPSDRGTFRALTVDENLRVPTALSGNRAAERDDRERVLHHFPRLAERLGQRAGTLSGGEQQMLAIARALMLRPRLLMLDEPSFGLAPRVVEEVFAILRRIRDADRMSVLLVEQNLGLALAIADHAVVLDAGRVALAGLPDEAGRLQIVRRVYLGA
jgi:branched-chain amino acid transport system ATP-binding protein